MKKIYLNIFLLTLIVNGAALKAQAQNLHEASRFNVNVKLLYPFTFFSLQTVPTVTQLIGIEYGLSPYVVAQLDYNPGYVKSERVLGFSDDLKQIRSFTNDYNFTRLRIGLNIDQFFNASSRFKVKVTAGSGHLRSRVNSYNFANEFRTFEKDFFTLTSSLELAYLINHYWMLSLSGEYVNAQTHYMDNQVSKNYDAMVFAGLGVKYTIHTKQQSAPALAQIPVVPAASEDLYAERVNQSVSGLGYDPMVNSKLDSIRQKVDTVALRVNEIMTASGLSIDRFMTGDTIAVKRLPIITGKKYNIIVASFSVYELDKGVRMVLKSDDKLFLISGRKNTTKVRVAIFSSNSFKEASKIRDFCRNSIGYKDAWIYKK